MKTRCQLLVTGLCLPVALTAQTSSTTWKGGAANLNWSTNGNWLSGVPTAACLGGKLNCRRFQDEIRARLSLPEYHFPARARAQEKSPPLILILQNHAPNGNRLGLPSGRIRNAPCKRS